MIWRIPELMKKFGIFNGCSKADNKHVEGVGKSLFKHIEAYFRHNDIISSRIGIQLYIFQATFQLLWVVALTGAVLGMRAIKDMPRLTFLSRIVYNFNGKSEGEIDL